MVNVLKYTKLIISFWIIFIIFGTNKVFATNSNTLLKDAILSNQVYEYNSDLYNDGLYIITNDNTKRYFYAGNVQNNNLVLNGLKFKILEIDDTENIKIMFDEDTLYATSKNYLDILNTWYNEKFGKFDTANLILKTNICDSLHKKTYCNEQDIVDVGLLTLQEFNRTKVKNNSFLKKEYNYYLWTTYYNHKYYYNAIKDEIRTTKNEEFNIYPVITLSQKAMISKGDGTEISPWIIANTIYGDSENITKEDKIVKLDNPKIIEKKDIDLIINDNSLNSITYEIYNNNLKYSIKFMKKNMSAVQNFNLEIKLNNINEEIYSKIDDILKYKNYSPFIFTNTSEFPNTAIITINVEKSFKDEDILWLYFYNENEEKLEYIDNNLIVENNLVNINLNKGGQYILTTEEIRDIENTNDIMKYIYTSIIIIVIMVIFSIFGNILYKKIKKV